MLKKQMEYELKVAQERIELNHEESRQIRENISKFLGSWETSNQWRREPEVKVLSWAEIYFELGKLQSYNSTLRNDLGTRSDIENLQSIVRSLQEQIKKSE